MILAQNWPKPAKSSWHCTFKETSGENWQPVICHVWWQLQFSLFIRRESSYSWCPLQRVDCVLNSVFCILYSEAIHIIGHCISSTQSWQNLSLQLFIKRGVPWNFACAMKLNVPWNFPRDTRCTVEFHAWKFTMKFNVPWNFTRDTRCTMEFHAWYVSYRGISFGRI